MTHPTKCNTNSKVRAWPEKNNNFKQVYFQVSSNVSGPTDKSLSPCVWWSDGARLNWYSLLLICVIRVDRNYNYTVFDIRYSGIEEFMFRSSTGMCRTAQQRLVPIYQHCFSTQRAGSCRIASDRARSGWIEFCIQSDICFESLCCWRL